MTYFFWSKMMLFAAGMNFMVAFQQFLEGEIGVALFFAGLFLFGLFFAEYTNDKRES